MNALTVAQLIVDSAIVVIVCGLVLVAIGRSLKRKDSPR